MASMRVAQISEFGGIQALRLEEVVLPLFYLSGKSFVMDHLS